MLRYPGTFCRHLGLGQPNVSWAASYVPPHVHDRDRSGHALAVGGHLRAALVEKAPMRRGVPKGIRTPVTAVKGRCPGPLDDGDGLQVSRRSLHTIPDCIGGARRDRTADLLHAMQALSQLSYGPTRSRRKLRSAPDVVKRGRVQPWRAPHRCAKASDPAQGARVSYRSAARPGCR